MKKREEKTHNNKDDQLQIQRNFLNQSYSDLTENLAQIYSPWFKSSIKEAKGERKECFS